MRHFFVFYVLFLSALSKFCEAIIEYLANIKTAPDPAIKAEQFAGEVFSAWEIFFNVWLASKEAKVVSEDI